MNITITDISAVLGFIFGLSGLIVAVFAYLRDRPTVSVKLQWDMRIGGDPERTSEDVGLVTVVNVGRRPIYLSHVSLKLPKSFEWPYLTLLEGIQGIRLEEGDAPKPFTIKHSDLINRFSEDLHKAPNSWKRIRAMVWDSAGKIYISKKVKEEPAWSKELKSNNQRPANPPTT